MIHVQPLQPSYQPYDPPAVQMTLFSLKTHRHTIDNKLKIGVFHIQIEIKLWNMSRSESISENWLCLLVRPSYIFWDRRILGPICGWNILAFYDISIWQLSKYLHTCNNLVCHNAVDVMLNILAGKNDYMFSRHLVCVSLITYMWYFQPLGHFHIFFHSFLDFLQATPLDPIRIFADHA